MNCNIDDKYFFFASFVRLRFPRPAVPHQVLLGHPERSAVRIQLREVPLRHPKMQRLLHDHERPQPAILSKVLAWCGSALPQQCKC